MLVAVVLMAVQQAFVLALTFDQLPPVADNLRDYCVRDHCADVAGDGGRRINHTTARRPHDENVVGSVRGGA